MQKKSKILGIALVTGGALVLLIFNFGYSAWFSNISDTITNSNPGATADHNIEFTATNAVPASGKIIITPEAGKFNIPAGFDFRDVDLTIGGVERSLAVAPTATEDGVAVVTGISGNITITLNSATGISAGQNIEILLGDSASFEFNGDSPITNPSATGSYELYIETQNVSSARIDAANTEIAIIDPVSMTADTTDPTPPVRSNGLPSGELPAGITSVEISLETDELATCRYDTIAGTAYSAMTSIITNTPEQTLHSTEVTTEDGQTYEFYIRCANAQGLANDDDFLITFSIKETPVVGSDPGEIGGEDIPATGGTGSGSGEAYPPDTASINFTGRAFPSGTVVVLMDGVKKIEGTTTINGGFEISLSDITKGVYTFTIYALDSDENKTTSFNTTFTIRPNTHSVVSGIFLSPTVNANPERVEPGEIVTLSGHAFPNSDLSIRVVRKGNLSDIKNFTTQATGNGTWSLEVDTTGYAVSVYQGSAQSEFGLETSDFAPFAEFGVGVDLDSVGEGCGPSADLNCDTKVNLVDFSILLFHWNTSGGDSNPPADINGGGSVELADFSIMLFQWTG